MPQHLGSLTPSFVKTRWANGIDRPDTAADARFASRRCLTEILDHPCKTMNLMGHIPNYGAVPQYFTRLSGKRAGKSCGASNGRAAQLLRHVAVRRHKVTMLRHLVLIRSSRLAQEANMAERVPDTPYAQSARRREKTFTRQQRLTLRSHSSCIHARGVPNFYGAADVSGR